MFQVHQHWLISCPLRFQHDVNVFLAVYTLKKLMFTCCCFIKLRETKTTGQEQQKQYLYVIVLQVALHFDANILAF